MPLWGRERTGVPLEPSMDPPEHSDSGPLPSTAAELFEAHGRHLWGIAYRMLGVGADADELVQECFARFLARPPALDRPVRPWLVKVTVNLARDRLRERKRVDYSGPWLPAPIDDASPRWTAAVPSSVADPQARYSELESLSMGFLLAAEQLSEAGRAVLVLRDVFGYSVRDTAEVLGLSESNVKTSLHRTRQQMRGWETEQRRSLRVPHERVVDAMRRFFMAIAAGDRVGAEAMLAADVVLLSDGGGEFFAARRPVEGAAKITRFYDKLSRTQGLPTELQSRTLGGVPTLIITQVPTGPHSAPRVCIQVEVGEDGRIKRIYSVLARAKVASSLGDV